MAKGRPGSLGNRIGGKRSAGGDGATGTAGTTGAGKGMSGRVRTSPTDPPHGSAGSGQLAGGGGMSRSLVDHSQDVTGDRHARADEQKHPSGGRSVKHPHGTERVTEHHRGR